MMMIMAAARRACWIAVVLVTTTLLLTSWSAQHVHGHLSTTTQTIKGAGASLPLRLYKAALALYTLQSTNATIEYKSTGSSSGLRALDEGTIDWAATDLFVSKANVTLLPTVAAPITVVYNLPEAQFAQGHHTDRIFLDAAAITGIFDGTIARWNHPALQALNPSLSHALPDKDIQVVVRADASGTTSIFTTAMSRLNTTWAANIGNGSRVDWPVPASRLHAANRTAGTAATLVTTPYSIGYLVLSEALEHGLLYAGFVSSAGHKLLPTQAAMTAAVIEFRSSSFGAILKSDLTASLSPDAWPISGYSYVAIRDNFMRPGTDCSTRVATEAFWRWYFTDGAMRKATEFLGFTPIPEVMSEQVLFRLGEAFSTCETQQGSQQALITRIGGVGTAAVSEAFQFIALAFAESYTGGAVAVTYTGETNATHLFEDFNTIFGANTQGSTWLEVPSQPATSDQQATMLLTNMGLQVVVHIITNADEETQLVLSLPTLAAMFLNTVQYWDDAAIASDNPGFQLPHHRITLVLRQDACDDTLLLSQALSGASEDFKSNYGVFRTWPSTPPAQHVWSTGTTHSDALVLLRNSTMAYMLSLQEEDIRSPMRSVAIKATATSDSIMLDTNSLSNCIAGPDSQPVDGCYPIASPILLSFPLQFKADVCPQAKVVADFLNFFYGDQITFVLEHLGLGLLSSSNVGPHIAALKAIRCAGRSLLDPEPACTNEDIAQSVTECDTTTGDRFVQYSWKESSRCLGGITLPDQVQVACDHVKWGTKTSITIAVFVGICLIPTVALFIWVMTHRSLRLVRYMQPVFVSLFLVACMTLLLSQLTLPGFNSSFMCIVRVWALRLTWTFVFATLFAKMYRVWRLFVVNRKIRRMTISNVKLLRIVGALMAIQLMLLVVLMIFDMPRSEVVDVSLGLPQPVPSTQCSSALWFEAAQTGYKGFMMMLGVFFAIQTWNVSSEYTEARPMAIAVSNIVFVDAIITILVTLVGVNEALEKPLVAFGNMWSAAAAVTAVFGPRLVGYYRHGDRRPAAHSVSKGLSGVSSGRRNKKQRATSIGSTSSAGSDSSSKSKGHTRAHTTDLTSSSARDPSDRMSLVRIVSRGKRGSETLNPILTPPSGNGATTGAGARV